MLYGESAKSISLISTHSLLASATIRFVLGHPWLRARDVDLDGDIDFVPDDAGLGFIYLNDGNGQFTKSSVP